jgi:hypothetical protein
MPDADPASIGRMKRIGNGFRVALCLPGMTTTGTPGPRDGAWVTQNKKAEPLDPAFSHHKIGLVLMTESSPQLGNPKQAGSKKQHGAGYGNG